MKGRIGLKHRKRKTPVINNWYLIPNGYIKTFYNKGRWVDRLCGVIEQDKFEAAVIKLYGNGLVKTTRGLVKRGTENITLNRNTDWI